MFEAAHAEPCFTAEERHAQQGPSTDSLSYSQAARKPAHSKWPGVIRDALFAILLGLLLIICSCARIYAQSECLVCHSDKDMKDAAGHSLAVDGDKFGA